VDWMHKSKAVYDLPNEAAMAGVDDTSWMVLASSVLAGLAGPAACFEAVPGMIEPLTAPNLLLPCRALRLRRMLDLFLDVPRVLQTSMIARSATLRTDLLERVRFGATAPSKGKDRQVAVTQLERHRQALQAPPKLLGGEPDGDPVLYDDLSHASDLCREDALLRPAYMLENPELDKLPALLAGCTAGHALVTGELTTAVLRSPAMDTVARMLDGATVEGKPVTCNRTVPGAHLTKVGATAILRLGGDALETMVARESGILGRFMILQPDKPATFDPQKNGDGWTRSLAGAMRSVIASRRVGGMAKAWMSSEAAGREFVTRRLRFEAEVEDTGDPGLTALASLPTVIAWAILRLNPACSNLDEVAIKYAFFHSEMMLGRIRRCLDQVRSIQRRASVDRHAARMLDRLRVGGSMTRRQLVRGFDCQRAEVHEPVIRNLIDSGLVREDGRLLVLGGVSSEPAGRR